LRAEGQRAGDERAVVDRVKPLLSGRRGSAAADDAARAADGDGCRGDAPRVLDDRPIGERPDVDRLEVRRLRALGKSCAAKVDNVRPRATVAGTDVERVALQEAGVVSPG